MYLALWLQEDGDNEDEEEAEETLKTKQELIHGTSVLAPMIEHANETISAVQARIKAEVRSLYLFILRTF